MYFIMLVVFLVDSVDSFSFTVVVVIEWQLDLQLLVQSPLCSCNIVESGVKHHKHNKKNLCMLLFVCTSWCLNLSLLVYHCVSLRLILRHHNKNSAVDFKTPVGKHY